jgi:Cu/Ag efflux pump CusA
MIEKIINFSAAHKLAVLTVIGAACIAGWWAMVTMPLDATPDLSDTQVIIYSHWDRSPDIVEDQVTYPIVAAMLGAPKVKTVRGFSDFGYSYVYVIFQDGTDLYWARSRVLEYLSSVTPRLPEGVKTELGPDATALGWAVRTGGYLGQAQSCRPALLSGLVSKLLPAVRSWGGGGSAGWWVYAPIPGKSGPQSVARLRHTG